MARRQCSKSGRVFGGDPGLAVGLLGVGREQRSLQERNRLVEHARVARRLDVVRHRVGQPQEVVGAARAGAAAARLVPPVLDVAFEELAPGRSQQVLAAEVGPGEAEGHDVLELVAESEGAAGLVVGGTGPQPAAHVLVEQPPVHQQVEGIVGGANLDGAQDVVPPLADPLQGGFRRLHSTMPSHQIAGLAFALALSQQEDQATGVPGGEGDADVQGGAGVEPRPEVARQGLAPKPAGWAREPFRPRNDNRSPVAERTASLAWAKATRPANSWL